MQLECSDPRAQRALHEHRILLQGQQNASMHSSFPGHPFQDPRFRNDFASPPQRPPWDRVDSRGRSANSPARITRSPSSSPDPSPTRRNPFLNPNLGHRRPPSPAAVPRNPWSGQALRRARSDDSINSMASPSGSRLPPFPKNSYDSSDSGSESNPEFAAEASSIARQFQQQNRSSEAHTRDPWARSNDSDTASRSSRSSTRTSGAQQHPGSHGYDSRSQRSSNSTDSLFGHSRATESSRSSRSHDTPQIPPPPWANAHASTMAHQSRHEELNARGHGSLTRPGPGGSTVMYDRHGGRLSFSTHIHYDRGRGNGGHGGHKLPFF